MCYWHTDDLRTYVQDGAKKISMPRYYREKIFNDYDMTDRNMLLQEEARSKDKKLFIDYLIRYPNGNYDDYWQEKNERRKAAYINLANKKKCKL